MNMKEKVVFERFELIIRRFLDSVWMCELMSVSMGEWDKTALSGWPMQKALNERSRPIIM